MLTPQRREEILTTLERQGGVKVAELSRRLEVTAETIRRDLRHLEKEGRLVRIHGGALPEITDQEPLPYQHREIEHVEAKRAIARRVLHEIREEDVLFLDGSTTAYHVARLFPDIRCTVLTHSEPVFRELSRRTNVELVSTGGVYDRPTACFVGPLAEQMLENLHITRAFLGCKGIDFQRGYSDASVRHMSLKRAVIRGADKVCILADHSKIDVRARYFFASIADVDMVVTDARVGREHRQAMREAGINFLLETKDAT